MKLETTHEEQERIIDWFEALSLALDDRQEWDEENGASETRDSVTEKLRDLKSFLADYV